MTNAVNTDLAWLLNDLVTRVREVDKAIVLSNDGLLLAFSSTMSRDDAEHLAALASGVQSLARGASSRFGGGPVQQTIIEMQSTYLFVTAAGSGASLGVLATENADLGLIAYEMAKLVKQAGRHLTAPARTNGAGAGK
ncbi:roadblock/LC7 domain-containing protein [Micromonospora endolithica]|uniref:Roadblock/LC7 domain-containing protein n=1 Tax=Micromonospora endolithica TaxID=230091 RepID=A0A3A9ZRP6_9ACTN|nr:roadblock/LC7 domain-containing protein [Micromonospora endolithica]RKN50624.1 roadblock/LC7 domain-containing protein [Micromonospora endolithica]TWJ20650.1 putative regulator of Ras-like GTPase activity (Roadblock/LC7/MglB family) [Micromonospora endolithica]